ncbi:cytochrome P450 [Actinoplanes sp. NBRC 103695]|uniref:cytochrome P450 n=1 Tax=Actinoplanes sp. NBRC 103695 TaxID=3032202 RepID=UPI0024A4AEE4|nr:cytochrome P450 [Actinoplanes sp. NBRC 103695]GLZ00134.1 hypothetical protein Acsp02_73860 [Actinoplanes sp. NBRC 103695]
MFKVFAMRTLSPSDLLERLPTADNRRYTDVRKRLRSIVDGVVSAHHHRGGDGHDLLSTLGPGYSDQQLADEVATILITAIEPTAIVISWFFYYLAQHPEVTFYLQTDARLG